jgi:hypothetical protein
MDEKTYLGDSVYAVYDGNGIVLTTENEGSFNPSNTIYIDSEVWTNLLNFVNRLKAVPPASDSFPYL